jgi:hypothetical protein
MNRRALKKDIVIDDYHIHKKTIAIVFSVIAAGFVLIGFALLIIKYFFTDHFH